ncbi:Protein of unknown function [Succinivibrio dextrinosolvens DSM 3072]|uniref:DUF805 domain-containing protein n=1 Tax=Succinivibrio dextrinosolvens DSM 3072 TaxID=1123324 RepID=A0A1T4VMM6_9GAMM|nr:DUF805 domain-containing protein [Succinivibrio dextrinosolvens]SKA66213.1 Protein of unknown function [Succinivibrio dextrinosolvens DSM 3072]
MNNKVMKRGKYSVFAVLFFIWSFFYQFASNSAVSLLESPYASDSSYLIASFVFLIGVLVTFLFAYFCMARRLRDCGKNTYLAWLIVIPLVGFVFMIYLCFATNKNDTNQQ